MTKEIVNPITINGKNSSELTTLKNETNSSEKRQSNPYYQEK